jgi:hypothetical protein
MHPHTPRMIQSEWTQTKRRAEVATKPPMPPLEKGSFVLGTSSKSTQAPPTPSTVCEPPENDVEEPPRPVLFSAGLKY